MNPTVPDLTARLECLLRVYATACDQAKGDADQLAEQFRKDLRLLIVEFGAKAVDAALDGMPDGGYPAATLH
jgi:hypothetical protein